MRSHWLSTLGTIAVLTLSSASAAPVPPDEVVKTTTAQLQQVIQKRRAEFRKDPQKLYDVMETMVVPRFDIKYIAQLILARNWRGASDQQRGRFEAAFKNMLIRTYATAMVDNADSVEAEWLPLRMADGDKDVTVDSKLLRPGKPPVPIGFAMRLTGDDWKIYDIVIENLSLVQNFRSQVSSEIKRSNLDAVIEKLEKGDSVAASAGKVGS